MLYDQFNRPIASTKLPDRRPLAAAPLTDSWREYVASGLTPQKLAALLREADAGDVLRQAELFDQIEERDGHLVGEIGKRRNVILDVDFRVVPASEDARDQKIADFVEETFKGITDFADVLVAGQDAVGKGFSCQEINWDVSSGQAVPTGFEFIEQKRFLFQDEKGVLSRVPLLLTDEATTPTPISAWKCLFHLYGGKSGHPTRSGIFRVCAWWYLFKNYSIKDWVIFCEVYGMPLRLGKYSPGASEADKDALATAIRSLGSDAAGIVSESTAIEFIESAKGKASGDLYQALATFANREMSKAVLGATLTAEVDGKGSYAAANVHNDVRTDLLRADSRALAASIRHQVIRPLVGFNFGWDAEVPGYEAQWDEPEDYKAKSEWMDKVLARVSAPVSWVRKEFGIPEPEKDEETVGGPAPAPEPTPAAAKLVAAKDGLPGPDAAEVFADRLEAAGLLDGWIDQAKALLDQAKSLEEFRDGLIGLFPDMDPEAFAELMAEALAAADLAGRFEVLTE